MSSLHEYLAALVTVLSVGLGSAVLAAEPDRVPPESTSPKPAGLRRAGSEGHPLPLTATREGPGGGAGFVLPAEFADPLFDRHVDLALIPEAVASRSAGLLTDVALQLAEGERVLARPHRSGVTSQGVFRKAVKLAVDADDPAALDRLARAADALKDDGLKADVAAARKLAGPARAVNPALTVALPTADLRAVAQLKGYLDTIREADLLADTVALADVESRMKEDPLLTEGQRKAFGGLVADARESAGKEIRPEDAAIRKLVATTRDDPLARLREGIKGQIKKLERFDPSEIPGLGQQFTRIYLINTSGRSIQVALDYTPRTAVQNRREGWWQLEPGEKAYVVDTKGHIGFFAETTDNGGPYMWWGGGGPLPSNTADLKRLPYDQTLLPIGRIHEYTITFEMGAGGNLRLTQATNVWRHDRGSFTKGAGTAWTERAPGGQVYHFLESSRGRDPRGGEWVELVSRDGATRVRLFSDRCDVGSRPDWHYRTFYRGGWSSR